MGDLKVSTPSVFIKDASNSNESLPFYDFTSDDIKDECMMYISKSDFLSEALKAIMKTWEVVLCVKHISNY